MMQIEEMKEYEKEKKKRDEKYGVILKRIVIK